MEPEVLEIVVKYLRDEYGNAGSRTHEYGARAKQAIELARHQVAAIVNAQAQEVAFTSGATESSNLAILGLRTEGLRTGKTHLVTSAIEHKSVLEPFFHLQQLGFELTIVPPLPNGRVDVRAIRTACRPETLLVSLMAINNETGVIQPIEELTSILADEDVYLHVDAAQAFGKLPAGLTSRRIDLLSISAHKIHGPKGIGALVHRRRGNKSIPLTPLLFGGGQERGLRSGTLPVALIAGFGHAATLADRYRDHRLNACRLQKEAALAALSTLPIVLNGEPEHTAPWILNISLPGIDSEAAILSLKYVAAISNGAACTSSSYLRSHVLEAMALSDDRIESALRLSWCHSTAEGFWPTVAEALRSLA